MPSIVRLQRNDDIGVHRVEGNEDIPVAIWIAPPFGLKGCPDRSDNCRANMEKNRDKDRAGMTMAILTVLANSVAAREAGMSASRTAGRFSAESGSGTIGSGHAADW